jgi:hypothetical protein
VAARAAGREPKSTDAGAAFLGKTMNKNWRDTRPMVESRGPRIKLPYNRKPLVSPKPAADEPADDRDLTGRVFGPGTKTHYLAETKTVKPHLVSLLADCQALLDDLRGRDFGWLILSMGTRVRKLEKRMHDLGWRRRDDQGANP